MFSDKLALVLNLEEVEEQVKLARIMESELKKYEKENGEGSIESRIEEEISCMKTAGVTDETVDFQSKVLLVSHLDSLEDELSIIKEASAELEAFVEEYGEEALENEIKDEMAFKVAFANLPLEQAIALMEEQEKVAMNEMYSNACFIINNEEPVHVLELI